MAIARRLKPIVGVNEYEVGPRETVFHPDEPFIACLLPLSERPIGWDDLASEDCSWEDVRRLQCAHIPLARGDDTDEDVDQVWIEVSPLLRTVEIPDVPPISVVDLIGEPPCDTKAVSAPRATPYSGAWLQRR